MRFTTWAIGGMMVAANPAAAQEIADISLVPGDAVTVRIDEAGAALAPERSRAQWARFDIAAARHLSGITPPEVPQTEAMPMD